MMKTVALVPIKLNNERTPGKNTKQFSDGTPLIHCILKTLKTVTNIDEIYVYCSNEDIKNFLIPGVNYLKRDTKYDTADASMRSKMKHDEWQKLLSCPIITVDGTDSPEINLKKIFQF